MNRTSVFALLTVLFWCSVALADPLRGGGAPMPSEGGVPWLPDMLAPLMGWMMGMQRALMGTLQEQLALARSGGSMTGLSALAGAAFIYGIIHAAGPGHGKVVVGSYFVGRRARIAQALAMSAAASLAQAISAIVLVGVFSLVLEVSSRKLLANAVLLETVSFALVVALGLGMIWRTYRGVGCCDHGDGHVHGPGCSHHHHRPSRREMAMAAMAVGLRPCTGAILVLLFTFANGLPWWGIAATLAMAAGTAITVAAVSMGAMGIRLLTERVYGGARLGKWLSYAGGALVTLLGLAMLAAALAS